MPRKPKSKPVAAAVIEAQATAVEAAPVTEAVAELPQPVVVAEGPPPAVQQVIERVAESTRIPDPVPTEAMGDDAQIEREKQAAPKLRATLGFTVPGGSIQMIDDLNRGLGIKFNLPEGEKPSPYVLEPVKEDRVYNDKPKRGMSWVGQIKQWRKAISENPIGDRLEVEGRTRDAAARYLEEKSRQGDGRTPF